VLFVCAGNTDRSPLAAACLRRRLAERLGCRDEDLASHGFGIESAGLQAVEGRPPSPSAQRIAREWPGRPLDLSGHQSKRLAESMLDRATHVFCMERAQVDEILAFFPGRARDVRLLDPEGHDVEDPAGKSLLAYKRLAGRLDAAAALIAGGLVASASSS
jgi:protein-tyrosine-phosphatase